MEKLKPIFLTSRFDTYAVFVPRRTEEQVDVGFIVPDDLSNGALEGDPRWPVALAQAFAFRGDAHGLHGLLLESGGELAQIPPAIRTR